MKLMLDENVMKKITSVEEFWGDQMPLNLSEETGELLTAVSKFERYSKKAAQDMPGDVKYIHDPSIFNIVRTVSDIKKIFTDEYFEKRQAIIDEMGDVIICILALAVRYSIDVDDIENRITEKLNQEK